MVLLVLWAEVSGHCRPLGGALPPENFASGPRGAGGSGVTAHHLLKDSPELSVEGGVDYRVYGTVDVAQPCDHRDEGGANIT